MNHVTVLNKIHDMSKVTISSERLMSHLVIGSYQKPPFIEFNIHIMIHSQIHINTPPHPYNLHLHFKPHLCWERLRDIEIDHVLNDVRIVRL